MRGATARKAYVAYKVAKSAGKWKLIAIATLTVGPFLFLGFMMIAFAAVMSVPEAAGQNGPSSVARADIPPEYYGIYRTAANEYGIDWAVLAAVGKVETNHGRLKAPGVLSGENSAGAGGPMQFLSGTWATMGVDGNKDGRKDRYDPYDAIPAAARYLKASGAPNDYHAALLAYNHAEWYVQQVLDQADKYRAAPEVPVLENLSEVRGRIVANAKLTLSSRTGYNRYSQAGALTDDPTPPPPARTDCSQWVRAIYLASGAPDPGTSTFDQIPKGKITTHPQPGDLMFSDTEGHVELYIGNGRTIGHGSAPIDYANVSNWPHHFFETYLDDAA